MAESENFLRIIKEAESNSQIKGTIEEIDRFQSFAESMGITTKKKEILISRDEMKFETVTSNWR